MSDKIEVNFKRQITRLRNIAKNKPMTLVEKLEIHTRVKVFQERLRQYRLTRYLRVRRSPTTGRNVHTTARRRNSMRES